MSSHGSSRSLVVMLNDQFSFFRQVCICDGMTIWNMNSLSLSSARAALAEACSQVGSAAVIVRAAPAAAGALAARCTALRASFELVVSCASCCSIQSRSCLLTLRTS